MPNRTAVLLANGEFQSTADLPDLAGPANDVALLTELLRDPEIGRFDVTPLVNAESREAQRVVESVLRKAGPSDFIVIYYSGHGKLDYTGQLYLATRDTQVDTLRATSLPVAFLKSTIEDSRCGQILLLLDCCFSGAVGKAFGLRSGPGASDQLAIMQQGQAGLHILASSTSIQTSREHEVEDERGVFGIFTRILAEGIRTGAADADDDGVITVQDVREHLQRELRGQTPQYWGFAAAGDPVVAWNQALAEQRRTDAHRKRLSAWCGDGLIAADVLKASLEALSAEGSGNAALDARLKKLIAQLTDDPVTFNNAVVPLLDPTADADVIPITAPRRRTDGPETRVVTAPRRHWKIVVSLVLALVGGVVAWQWFGFGRSNDASGLANEIATLPPVTVAKGAELKSANDAPVAPESKPESKPAATPRAERQPPPTTTHPTRDATVNATPDPAAARPSTPVDSTPPVVRRPNPAFVASLDSLLVDFEEAAVYRRAGKYNLAKGHYDFLILGLNSLATRYPEARVRIDSLLSRATRERTAAQTECEEAIIEASRRNLPLPQCR